MNKVKSKWNEIPIEARASIAYIICDIIQHGLAFFTLPLFAKHLLTTEEYGQVTIYASWSGILTLFLTLNLAYGSFAKAMVKYEDDRDGYISAIEGITVALSLIFLAIYLPFHSLWNRLFELPTYIICIMVMELLSVNAVMLWSGKKRFEYRYVEVIAVTLFIAFSTPAMAVLLIFNSDEKGYARIIGFAIVNITVGFSIFVLNLIRGKKFFNKEYWKYALGFNVPLLAYYLSQVIFNQSDRIMISHIVGKSKAAVYGVAYSLAMVLTFVLNAINNSYLPWFYGKIKEEKQEENRGISLGIAIIMAVLLSGVIWYAPEIIQILGGKKYFEARYVIPPVAISVLLLFYSQLFINVEFYYERKKELVWASIGAAITNLVLNWIFIQKYGFVAAGYTTMVSYIIFAFSNYVAMKGVLKDNNEEDVAYNYPGLVLVFLLFCALSAVGMIFYNNLVVRIIITVLVLAIIFIKKDFFIKMYVEIKGKKDAE